MNKKNYVTYEVAKLLHSKIKPCIEGNYYFYRNGKFTDVNYLHPIESDEVIHAPRLSDIQDWLRKHRNIYVNPIPSCSNNDIGDNRYYWTFQILNIQDNNTIDESYIKSIDGAVEEKEKEFDTYENALNGGIKEVLISIK